MAARTHPALRTRLCDLLGIDYPIIQAGMGYVADAALATPVSAAGGLGMIGAAYFPGEELREQIRTLRRATDRTFGVNILFATAPNGEYTDLVLEQVEVCMEERVPVLSSGLGSPGKIVARAHGIGAKVVSLVGGVRAARKMELEGADVVVAQGWEAGGHNSKVATMALVPQVVDALKVPVVAAGGIGDGRGLVAALALGAQGVLCGTLFLTSAEARAHANYKQAVIAATDMSTLVTKALSGKPARLLANQWAKYYDAHPDEILPFPEQWYRMRSSGVGERARIEGEIEVGPLPAGQISGLLTRVRPVAEIITEMMAQATQILEEVFRAR